jgi:hypothetical protein
MVLYSYGYSLSIPNVWFILVIWYFIPIRKSYPEVV